ncbi:MAG: hypothetical protein GQ531_08235 [Sulfurovum sp.]|nr:hypothetical protein [Sulfurovum sp.]
MALVDCPECGNNISNKLKSICQKCGYIVTKRIETTDDKKINAQSKKDREERLALEEERKRGKNIKFSLSLKLKEFIEGIMQKYSI